MQAIKAGIAVVGMVVTAYLGGWDAALQFFIWALVIDYVTGVLAALRNKNLSSEVMFWGGLRKGLVLLVVAIAVQLDHMLGNTSPVFRTIAIYYYIQREAVSVVENLGILGIPLPPMIANRLTQLQGPDNTGNGQPPK